MSDAALHAAERRSAARLASIQALYQMEISHADAADVIKEFVAHRFTSEDGPEIVPDADVDHFSRLMRGVVQNQTVIDNLIEGCLAQGWTLNRLDAILRALLRSATFELTDLADVPARVVINEYVNVAHAFFDDKEPSFVNGVLDHMAREQRPGEFSEEEVDGNDVSAERN